MKKIFLKKISFILCFTIIISAINPITNIFADSSEIITQKYYVSTEREEFVEKYLINSSTGIFKFDIDRAKKDGVSESILNDAKEFNDSIDELQQEMKTRAGKTYVKKITHKKWEIGLSSGVCKAIITGMKFGVGWIISKLTALIPGIGPVVSVVSDYLLKQGSKILKNYTKKGIKITIMKHIYGSGWSITHRSQ